ncbi:LPS-assembly protein LptD [Campylobacter sp. MIT 99-7217]|nr:LPS-assembly protein LptD [Campylobacter sp. MIT 99-7217]
MLFFTSFFSLYATPQQVDFYTSSAQKSGDIISSDSEVLVFSDEYFISANKAKYNDKTKDIELFGNVNVLRGEKEKINSCYAKVNLNSNEADFENFFFANNDMEVWFQSGQSSLDDKFFTGKNSSVSSCNVENPDWQIKFSSADLNRDTQFLNVYNAKFYVKNVPIFYLPYFGFSVDTSRQTGLLIPKIELNSNDGFYYEQPIYIAAYDSWDLELDPQYRSSRGLGSYTTFRIVDSMYSNAEFNTGYFREQNAYFKKEQLKNKQHFGFEFKYLRTNLIKDFFSNNFQEGLWIDGIYLNDVDYLNLGRRDYRDLTSLATSKFNYFLADENNYYAMYSKYYIDTSVANNKNTLQEYPSFQYHRFLDGIFNNYIQYSFDANFHRYYREIGTYANYMDFDLPLTYHMGIFDDFLHFKFSESLHYSIAHYANRPQYQKDKEYRFENSHTFYLYTDLSKPYSYFYHSLHFGAEYFLTGAKSGEITEDFLKTNTSPQDFKLKAVQYFYNNKGEKKFKHRLNVNYDIDITSWDKLNNLVEYYLSQNITLSNEAEYSYIQRRFVKVLSGIDIDFNRFNLNFSHAYKYDSDLSVRQNGVISQAPKYSFIGTQANYSYNANFNFFSGIWFDTNRANINSWELGYTFQRKCWNYSLMYRERIDPQLTSAGIKAKNKSGVYFVFNLYPIGGVKYDFALEENENAVNSL